MKYRLSIWNVTAALLLAGAVLFAYFNAEQVAAFDDWEAFAALGIAALAVFGAICDFLLQLFIRNRIVLNAVEGGLLALAGVFSLLFIL